MSDHAELVGRARDLAPVIAERAADAEAMRRPPDETIRELIDAELISILVPRRWGGLQGSLHTHREVVEIISAACMSTGWILAFYSGHNWMALKFSEEAQAEFFDGKNYALIPVTTAPTIRIEPTDGGVIASGRSPWGTGIVHADWVCTGGRGSDGEIYIVAMRAEETTLVDSWHMAAMSGTGSNDFEIHDVFIPEHRVLRLLDFVNGDTPGARLHDDPVYLLPLMPFIYCEAMPVFSGGLRGATAAFEHIVKNRVRTHSRAVVADDKLAHAQLGEAAAAALVAERLVADQVRETIELAASGHAFSLDDRIRFKAQAGFVVDHCRRSVNDIIHHSGTSNFADDSPVQRFFRDINMLATHAFFESDMCREQMGRSLLGLKPTTPLI